MMQLLILGKGEYYSFHLLRELAADTAHTSCDNQYNNTGNLQTSLCGMSIILHLFKFFLLAEVRTIA